MKTSQFIEKQAMLMGSPFTIQAYVNNDRPREEYLSLFDLAFAEIRRIEDLLTDFRDSRFNRINDCAGICPVKVSQEIFDLIELSLNVSKDSDGAFDISYAALGALWREAQKSGVLPTQAQIAAAKALVNYKLIELYPLTREVYLPQKGMRVGFGGVGKGYAVDRAFELLIQEGIDNVMVNGAGDIRLHAAENAPRPWRIGIRNPFAEKNHAMGFFELSSGAVATSGDYERFFRRNNKKYHHVIDPRSGEFTESVASVTLIAQNTLMADIYATTAMALGPEAGIAFLNRRRNVRGMMITQEGNILKTQNLITKEVHSHA